MTEPERLARLETKIENIEAKQGYLALTQKETRDEIRVFRTELFKLLNPLNSQVSKHDESIRWIKRFCFISLSGLLGVFLKLFVP